MFSYNLDIKKNTNLKSNHKLNTKNKSLDLTILLIVLVLMKILQSKHFISFIKFTLRNSIHPVWNTVTKTA